MGIFSRIGKIFGRKDQQAIEQADYKRQQAKREAEVAQVRANAAKRNAADAARLARELSSPRVRVEKSRQAASTTEARQRAAQAEADRQRRLAQDAERNARLKAKVAEQKLRDAEQLRAKAREFLLKTRKNLDDKDFERIFKGPRPQRRVYDNAKTGEGDLPDAESFLKLGTPYSAFASSNVEILQFDPRTGDLYVCYIKGRWYKYRSVGRVMAAYLYQAASKGVGVWDELRVRGTVNGNKYATDKDVKPPTCLPLDEGSSAEMFGAAGGF